MFALLGNRGFLHRLNVSLTQTESLVRRVKEEKRESLIPKGLLFGAKMDDYPLSR